MGMIQIASYVDKILKKWRVLRLRCTGPSKNTHLGRQCINVNDDLISCILFHTDVEYVYSSINA